MNTQWQSFLQQAGAIFENDRVISFADKQTELHAAAEGTVLADLSHFGLIKAWGEECTDFLQNLFSNDIKEVSAQQSQLSAFCSPKGRMLASFRIFKHNDDYYLELSADIVENVLKRLRMFVLRTKVTLDDVSDDWVRIGIAGDKAETLLQNCVSQLPAEPNQAVQENELTLIRLPGDRPRFELHAQADKIIALWPSWCEHATPVGQDAWSWLETRAGIPWITETTVEAFVPQMANYQLIGGVSFKKGCYPGQEVVARMHYLGKLKRRMYLAHVDAAERPQGGDNLFPSGASGDAQSCGKVVQAQPAPEGGYDLLAVIQIASAENDELRLGSNEGPLLSLQTLPYAVANEA